MAIGYSLIMEVILIAGPVLKLFDVCFRGFLLLLMSFPLVLVILLPRVVWAACSFAADAIQRTLTRKRRGTPTPRGHLHGHGRGHRTQTRREHGRGYKTRLFYQEPKYIEITKQCIDFCKAGILDMMFHKYFCKAVCFTHFPKFLKLSQLTHRYMVDLYRPNILIRSYTGQW